MDSTEYLIAKFMNFRKNCNDVTVFSKYVYESGNKFTI